MAIMDSAKKEIRSSAHKRVFNLKRLRSMRSLIKSTTKKFKDGDIEGSRSDYVLAQKAIDKAEKCNIIKSRNASRKKSVLASSINPNKK